MNEGQAVRAAALPRQAPRLGAARRSEVEEVLARNAELAAWWQSPPVRRMREVSILAGGDRDSLGRASPLPHAPAQSHAPSQAGELEGLANRVQAEHYAALCDGGQFADADAVSPAAEGVRGAAGALRQDDTAAAVAHLAEAERHARAIPGGRVSAHHGEIARHHARLRTELGLLPPAAMRAAVSRSGSPAFAAAVASVDPRVLGLERLPMGRLSPPAADA